MLSVLADALGVVGRAHCRISPTQRENTFDQSEVSVWLQCPLPTPAPSVPVFCCVLNWVCQTGNSHPPHGVPLPPPLAQILHGGQGHGLEEMGEDGGVSTG